MKKFIEAKNLVKYYNFFIAGFVLVWTILILISLFFNLKTIKEESEYLIRKEAEVSFKKDLIYRRWNSLQGGVYALVSEQTQPNPYLDVRERDIETPSGKKLTLINPAYMTRMVYEIAKADEGMIGHMTSLKPIRPQNSADEWEKKALHDFENGITEYSSIEDFNGVEYLRYMKPFKTEKACLKCHEKQGYKEGEIRGGLSIAIPTAMYTNSKSAQSKSIWIWHSVIWLVVSVSIFLTTIRMKNNIIALKESETRFKLLFNNMSDAVLVFKGDPKNMVNIFEVNEKACKIFGYEKHEFIKLNPVSIFPEGITKKEKIEIKQNENSIIESYGITKDKKKIPLEITTQQFILDGEISTLTIARDISLRKMVEEMEAQRIRLQNLESLGILAGGIAHDFNNLLTAIMGQASLLSLKSEDEKVKKSTSSIIEATNKAALLAKEILTFAKGGTPLKQVVEIRKVINESVLSLGDLNIEIEYKYCEKNSLKADPVQISQVIKNILRNSKEAMSSHGKITISTSDVQEDDKPYVKISVKDTGIGIHKENLNKIFDPYFSTKTRGSEKGSGLGLSVCYSIIKRHNGKIFADSEVGSGTTIDILLPAFEEETEKIV